MNRINQGKRNSDIRTATRKGISTYFTPPVSHLFLRMWSVWVAYLYSGDHQLPTMCNMSGVSLNDICIWGRMLSNTAQVSTTMAQPCFLSAERAPLCVVFLWDSHVHGTKHAEKKTLHAGTIHSALAMPASPFTVPSKNVDTFAHPLPRFLRYWGCQLKISTALNPKKKWKKCTF